MNLYLRLLHLVLLGRRRSRVSVLGPVRTPFRVWPTDLDLLRHVNNGTYLTIMDIGRLDLLARSGVTPLLRRAGWYPVVVAETITFKRSLRLFQRFDVVTEVVGWDEVSLFLRQDVVRGDVLVASAVIRGRFLGRDGARITPQQVMGLSGEQLEARELPAWVVDWARSTEIRSATPVPPA
ncbi:acyl-CoA thioesterase [Aquipuribacter hungaricus]|uniref:Acyl-CoA thioesterase n=1 Tax=Aquipuribacter hungaricus TaxID=545624 RepID=A0ABV7WJ36_9MICO